MLLSERQHLLRNSVLHSLQQGADTIQLWHSCKSTLLLGELTLTRDKGHTPGAPILVSTLLFGGGDIDP